MPRYSVDCRYPDGEEPIVIGPITVEAESLHEAIGLAWVQLGEEVRSYGGTIDDLDGFELYPPSEAGTSQDYRDGYADALQHAVEVIEGHYYTGDPLRTPEQDIQRFAAECNIPIRLKD